MSNKNYSIAVSKEQYYMLKWMREHAHEFFNTPPNYKPTYADALYLFMENSRPNSKMRKVLKKSKKGAEEKVKEEAKAKEHEEHLEEIPSKEELEGDLHPKEEAEGPQSQTSESDE